MSHHPIRAILHPHMSLEARHGVDCRSIIHNSTNSAFSAHLLRGNPAGEADRLTGQAVGCSFDCPTYVPTQLFAFRAGQNGFPYRRAKTRAQLAKRQEQQQQSRPNETNACFEEQSLAWLRLSQEALHPCANGAGGIVALLVGTRHRIRGAAALGIGKGARIRDPKPCQPATSTKPASVKTERKSTTSCRHCS